MQATVIAALFGLILIVSFLAAPRRVSVGSFFEGTTSHGKQPELWTLVFSQVTTWIFARSLMNAAILGFYYGFAGVLAYAAYYGSFLTGAFVVGRMRESGAISVQDWLTGRFGAVGTSCYNVVIVLRLLSEVFANLIVVGLIFGAVLPEFGHAKEVSIVVVGIVALAYSAWGGLSAALRTDVVQMSIFLVVFGAAFGALLLRPDFDLAAIASAGGASGSHNGWVLLVVACLQVFSYPVHDPVMMDRGFIVDRSTTKKSFLHAFWISVLCIVAFGMFGVQASIEGAAYETQLIGTWANMFPPWVFLALMTSLLVSALSTLDSALSSAARLVVVEFGLLPQSLTGGRIAMLAFAVIGGVLTFWGNQTLFDAVAVSGTASMFLTPVLVATLVFRCDVAIWAYLVAFGTSLIGAFSYAFRDSPLLQAVLYEGHKYEQLLQICVVVLVVGFAAVMMGARRVEAQVGG
ncbi:Na+/proline symporter [Shimia isoporae]|uniref:Na+/proline symporter n=1 Tax=Shimia isoporae TaxID=647720 RepID=A0A4R1NMZ0_9RHOB|nr:sodium:proline symporter [Shimia isoporae]TCL09826.1 Na+/proline symporter [Shimia isoporae]